MVVAIAMVDRAARSYCYNAATGRHLWRFYTVPGDPSKGFENAAMRAAAKTWPDRWWKESGGAAVWNGITYDDELNRIYIGTGNANPWNPSVRNHSAKAATNLFTASVVAIDADTGRYVWHYQEKPDDAWDYDSAADMTIATQAGIALYGIHCTSCHGRDGISGGSAPDLQASPVPLSTEGFVHIVHDGALVAQGMPRYDKLSTSDLEAIRNFIRASAERTRP
jgi:hypothetical protein